MAATPSSMLLRRVRGEDADRPHRTRMPARFWRDAFRAVRGETERRAAPLSPGGPGRAVDAGREPDQMASRAHDLVLRAVPAAAASAGYRVFDERFAFLFNSYYVAAGPRHARPQRGLITRPDCAEVDGVSRACRRGGRAADRRSWPMADLAAGPAHPRDRTASRAAASGADAHRHPARLRAESAGAGLRCRTGSPPPARAGAAARSSCPRASTPSALPAAGFCFDNEEPGASGAVCGRCASRARWSPTASGSHFMADGGYATPALWLSDGWASVRGGGLDGARLLARARRRLARADARRAAAGRSAPRRSATSATTRPMRSRAGPASICRPRRSGRSRRDAAARRRLRRRLAMDAQRLFALSGLSRRGRRARRIQRQVHGQPDGAARQLAARRRPAMRARATAISSIRRRAGSSAACGWSITRIRPHDRVESELAALRHAVCMTSRSVARPADPIARNGVPARRARRPDARGRSGCRRNISTTRPARACSRRSPRCRNTIRPAASSRSCASNAARDRALLPADMRR